ncbi:MAG: bis(5'-nucleosyl)-tetraphosphatase (symmetrical) YqeK [Dehalococcoidia bacterium]
MDEISSQIAAVREALSSRPEGLQAHVGRVLEEALDLAGRWDLDPARVELAVWGHDLFRAAPAAEQLQLAAECGLRPTETERRLPVLLHGPNAAVVLRERFGVRDDEVLAGVREHTSGGAAMPAIAKVILLADKFEKRKRTRRPELASIRRAARRDLDLALLCWADWKWVDERERTWECDEAHWEARLRWVADHHSEIGLPGRTPDDGS